MRLFAVWSLLFVVVLGILLLGGCNRSDTVQPIGEKPAPPPPPPAPSSEFTITTPQAGEVVETDPRGRVVLRGTGAMVGSTIEVIVYTNDPFPQNGEATIESNGEWSYYPCYLQGEGQWKQHRIVARMTMPDGTVKVTEVDKVETTWKK